MTPQKKAPRNQPTERKKQQVNQVVQGMGVCFFTLGKGINRANYEEIMRKNISWDEIHVGLFTALKSWP